MPITLPQLTRREFIKRAALAGAAAALAPGCASRASGSRDPHTFALFSDSHIAADAAAVSRGVNMAGNLTACVQQLQALPVKPAALFVPGDLALSDGKPGEYATFGKLIEPARLLAPMHLTLGNHDQRENFWQAFPKDAERAGTVPQKQAAVYTSPRANWFMLDSLDKTNATPGDLGEAQRAWLAQELAARANKPAIIITHHNLGNTGVAGLKDTAAMEEILAKFPQVKAYIYGHTHEWSVKQHATGVHLINLPPVGYVFSRGRPSGWVRCTLTPDGMEVELRSLDETHPEHAQVKQLQWRA